MSGDADNADLGDQPPEVFSIEPGHADSLPPALPAAERVREFLRWYGDGLVVPRADEDGPPLYARDLEALARLAGAT